MRQLLLSPRWILWHLLTLGAMLTCGGLAVWQWQRAGSAMGSALNVGYGLQWPVFAVFFGVMWWRMLRMEAATLREAAEAAAPAESAESAESPESPEAAESPEPAGAVASAVSAAPPQAATVAGAPSPFGPRPRSAAPPPAEDDPELADYNQMLARLAARTEED